MFTDLLLINNNLNKKHSFLSLTPSPLGRAGRGLLLAFGFWLLAFGLMAQVNYVQNPSFELYNNCPDGFSEISYCQDWDTLKTSGGCGPDYYSACTTNTYISVPYNGYGSFQFAHSGNSIAQLGYYNPSTSSPRREYIQNKLKTNLKQSKKYCLTYYASLQNESKYAITELGAYLDAGTISTTFCGVITLTPQVSSPVGVYIADTLGWTKVQGTFTANGTESYLTLGNFKSTATTSFITLPPQTNGVQRFVADYYIDDVSVIEADLPAFAGRDTVLCNGDSLFIGRPPEIGLECTWFTNSTQIGTGGGIWVKPTTTQTFAVTQDVCGIITKDTIQVQIKPKYTGTVSIVSQATQTLLCPTNTTTLSVSNLPSNPNLYTYNWQPQNLITVPLSGVEGQTIIATMPQQSTTFTVTTYNTPNEAYCPYTLTSTVYVQLKPLYTGSAPIITASPNVVCPTNTVTLSVVEALPSNLYTYNWQPQNLITVPLSGVEGPSVTATLQQTTIFTVTTNYTLDTPYCPYTRTSTVNIIVKDTCNIINETFIPQGFSPNGDGINETFIAKIANVKTAKLMIFNRWGNEVFTSQASTPLSLTTLIWDGNYKGQLMPSATYFYIIETETLNGEFKNYKGFVVLMR